MNRSINILYNRFGLGQLALILAGYLMMEGIFSWVFLPSGALKEQYIKAFSIGVYAFMLYRFYSLKPVERGVLIFFTLMLVRLVLVSLSGYNSFFQQFTMFTVLVPVVYALFIKYVLREYQLDLLDLVSRFYLVTYVVFMVLFGRGFNFSLDQVEMDDYGPFSGDSRVIHASGILMIVIPFLYFLHRYIRDRKFPHLLLTVFCIAIMVVHQHRSVWSSAMMAGFFYFFAMIRNGHLTMGRSMNIFVQAMFAAIFTLFLVSQISPEMLSFLGERFAEILDPAKEGSTGNFRIEQREVYTELAKQHLLFGWSFEGFEMTNPMVDWWPEKTGQHFHEGYMEMLFYLGIVGLLFKFSVPGYILYRIFSRHLSEKAIIVSAFCICGLLFSFNYVLPFIYWAHAGMALYYIEQSDEAYEARLRGEAEEEESGKDIPEKDIPEPAPERIWHRREREITFTK